MERHIWRTEDGISLQLVFQMSEVVQELRATTQTLMDKVILVEAMLAERHLPPAE